MPNTIYRNKRAVLDLHVLTDKELIAAYEAIELEFAERDGNLANPCKQKHPERHYRNTDTLLK